MKFNDNHQEGQAEAYIEGLPMWAKKKNSLEEIRSFLEAMGNPDEKMKLLHVAGTNGKGSVCAYLMSILRETGCRAAAFTSPHLVNVRERFSICGEMVGADAFEKSFERVKKLSEAMMERGFCHPTYFEFLFYMAMDLFLDAGVEAVILETGMGGRLDTTNVIRHPFVCVITSVSMDHMAYLGDTLEKIAFEKSGIIKKGVPVVYDGNCKKTCSVIADQAGRMEAEGIPLTSADYRIEAYGHTYIQAQLCLADGTGLLVNVPSAAEYQVMNALLAVRVVETMKIPGMSAAYLKKGVEAMYWPGRMEQIIPGIWLDGAHNQGGIDAFSQTACRMCEQQGKRAYLLFSAVSDKEHRIMIEQVCKSLPLDGVIVVQLHSERGTGSGILVSEFLQETDCPVKALPDIGEAFEQALSWMDEEHLLFCIGSLYLMGEIKSLKGGNI